MIAGHPVNIELEKIADIPYYTEGPAVDSKNNIYFSTLSGKSILKIDVEGRITEWARSDCPNGHAVLPGDEHLVCDSKLAAIRRFDPDGIFLKDEVRGSCGGYPLNVPNDLVVNSKGDIYFTDSVRHDGAVYFIGSDGRQDRLIGNLDYPNGLALSLDEKILYVAESYKNRVVSINLEYDEQKEIHAGIFAALPVHRSGRMEDNLPDGLAIDAAGSIWVAHYGMQAVQVVSAGGKLLSSLNTTMPLTSNLMFAGKKALIVTGGYGEPGPGAVFRIYLSAGGAE